MLTIKHSIFNQVRQENSNFKNFSTENPEQSINVSSLESKSLIKSKKLNELDDNELLERYRQIKEENKNIRRENLLFSRYLLRMNTIKHVETFDDYEDGNDIINEILDQIPSSDSRRRISLKRNSGNTRKGIPGWTKVSVNWHGHVSASSIALIEHERSAIATYEIEQTRLEWQRMKANATTTLDKLEMLHRTSESDEIAQEALNRELDKRVDKYRADVGEEEFNSPNFTVPGELILNHINKRIKSRITVIGLLRINTTRLYLRLEEVNTKIRSLDDIANKLDEVDITLINTRKLDNMETFKKIDRKYKIEKSSQYPVLRRLHEWKKALNEQEISINDMNKKCELLQNYFDRTNIEINSIEEECQLILKENNIIKNRIDDIIKVPTITDYAYIIKQTEVLQHGIDISTKRVNIAENVLSQLQRQNKPPRRLLPLQPPVIDQYLSTKPSNR